MNEHAPVIHVKIKDNYDCFRAMSGCLHFNCLLKLYRAGRETVFAIIIPMAECLS